MTVDKGPQIESRQALLPLVVRHDVGGRLFRRRVGEGLLVCEQTGHLDRAIQIAERDGRRRRPGGRKRVCTSRRRQEQNDERDRGSRRDRADTDAASPGSMSRRLSRRARRRSPLSERRTRRCAPCSPPGSLRPRAAGARRKSREAPHRHCHVAMRRARAVYALRIFKPPRRPCAIWGFVTLPCGEREAWAPQELLGRCDCGPPRVHRLALSRWRLLLVNRPKRSSAADRKINGSEGSSVVLDPSKIRYSWPT